ncbi:MAG: GreA/GreB family elongation factor [Clostridia bacterium]|nr:GreA/GreB family elongation factor [Clostridia bacterium]
MQRKTYSTKFNVKVGDTVTFEYDNEIKTYTILKQILEYRPIRMGGAYGSSKYESIDITGADPKKGTINEKSPIAQAMLGKIIGESFNFTIDGKTSSGKILKVNSYTTKTKPIYPKEEIVNINRLSYTHYASGLYCGNLREFKIVVHREKGIVVRLKGFNGEFETKVIDFEPISKAKLKYTFEQLSKIQFPSQHHFTVNATDGDGWRLRIDNIEYRGCFTKPKFLVDILSIINYNYLYEKYNKAFEIYSTQKNKAVQ